MWSIHLASQLYRLFLYSVSLHVYHYSISFARASHDLTYLTSIYSTACAVYLTIAQADSPSSTLMDCGVASVGAYVTGCPHAVTLVARTTALPSGCALLLPPAPDLPRPSASQDAGRQAPPPRCLRSH